MSYENCFNATFPKLFPLYEKNCIKKQVITNMCSLNLGKFLSTTPTKTMERDLNVNLSSMMAVKLTFQSNVEFTVFQYVLPFRLHPTVGSNKLKQ